MVVVNQLVVQTTNKLGTNGFDAESSRNQVGCLLRTWRTLAREQFCFWCSMRTYDYNSNGGGVLYRMFPNCVASEVVSAFPLEK